MTCKSAKKATQLTINSLQFRVHRGRGKITCQVIYYSLGLAAEAYCSLTSVSMYFAKKQKNKKTIVRDCLKLARINEVWMLHLGLRKVHTRNHSTAHHCISLNTIV